MDIKKIAKEFQPNNTKAVKWFLTTVCGLLMSLSGAVFFLDISLFLFLFFVITSALFFLKLFTIQHDCGHYSFFETKKQNDFLGRILGVVTLTPYSYWQRHHNIHHAFVGNLDKRGDDGYVWGGYWTITKEEYDSLSFYKKMAYTLYHYPFFLIFIWPFLNFFVLYRIPFGKILNTNDKKSIIWTNLGILLFVLGIYFLLGSYFLFFVLLPVFYISAVLGPWLFMVQHNYKDTYWERAGNWSFVDAAMKGSSFYLLPNWLHYLTGNIGYHHVHHVLATIPSYKLVHCYEKNTCFHKKGIKIQESFQIPNLCLWDEKKKELVGLSHFRYVSLILYVLCLGLSVLAGYLEWNQVLFALLLLLFGVVSFPLVFRRNGIKATILLTFCGINYLYFYFIGANILTLGLLGYSFGGVLVSVFFVLYFSKCIFRLLLNVFPKSPILRFLFLCMRSIKNTL